MIDKVLLRKGSQRRVGATPLIDTLDTPVYHGVRRQRRRDKRTRVTERYYDLRTTAPPVQPDLEPCGFPLSQDKDYLGRFSPRAAALPSALWNARGRRAPCCRI